MTEPTLTVVVPVYNRVDLLDRTLAGFHQQSLPKVRFDVIVGDDGSTEDVEGIVAAHTPDLPISHVRQDHDGFGLARARNLAAAAAAGDVLVFLDADCIPAPDLLERHAWWHARAANLVVAGTRRDMDSSTFAAAAIAAGSAAGT